MTRTILLLLLLVGLSACDSTGGQVGAPSYDPHVALAVNEMGAEAARAAIQSTQSHLREQGELTIYRQTQVAADVYGAQSLLQVTQTALAIDQQRMIPTQTYEASMLAWYGQGTQVAALAPQSTATAEALLVATTIERAKVQRGDTLTWAGAIAIVLVGGSFGWSFMRWTDWKIERDQILSGLRETRSGPAVFDREAWTWVMIAGSPPPPPRELPDLNRVPSAPYVEEHDTYNVGSPNATSSPLSGTSALVLEFLRAAKAKQGGDSTVIPSWNKMGIPSEKWQRAKASLEAEDQVYSVPGQGTYVKDGDIDSVLYKIETGQVRLRPTPPGRYASE